jgi:hypothetical protein
MRIELRKFLRDDGSSPCQAWFEGLAAQAAAKVLREEYKRRKRQAKKGGK